MKNISKTFTFSQALSYLTYDTNNKYSDTTVIAVAGPSCSGKTTFAKQLEEQFLHQKISVSRISADDYFKDIDDSTLPLLNNYPLFDHPDAYCSNEISKHITDLVVLRKPINKPNYIISQNKRNSKYTKIYPNKIIIFEGLFAIFEMIKIVDALPNLISIYVDANYSTRLQRRIKRDMAFVKDPSVVEKVFNEVVEKQYTDIGCKQKMNSEIIIKS